MLRQYLREVGLALRLLPSRVATMGWKHATGELLESIVPLKLRLFKLTATVGIVVVVVLTAIGTKIWQVQPVGDISYSERLYWVQLLVAFWAIFLAGLVGMAAFYQLELATIKPRFLLFTRNEETELRPLILVDPGRPFRTEIWLWNLTPVAATQVMIRVLPSEEAAKAFEIRLEGRTGELRGSPGLPGSLDFESVDETRQEWSSSPGNIVIHGDRAQKLAALWVRRLATPLPQKNSLIRVDIYHMRGTQTFWLPVQERLLI